MIILSLQNIKKAFGGNEVLTGLNLTLQEGERMGMVGVNGSGKSTLMKIIFGLETADDGSINMKKGLKMGYLAQQGMVADSLTVYQELEMVFEPLRLMELRLRELEQEMARAASDPDMLHRLGGEYQRLTDEFEEQNGYGRESAIMGVLSGLGFTKEQHSQLASQLSGGERTRLCLGRLLLQKPELLLLDEPTNHLDLAAISWLEKYLIEYKGTVLIISHDRYFLDKVCNNIAELLLGTCEQYTGNYSDYSKKRAQQFEIRMKAYEMQKKEIARQEAIIARYRMFNREKSIRAAESREKRLEKVERLQKPTEESAIRFRFEVKRRTGEDVLMIRDYKKSFPDRLLFQNLNLHLRLGDRVALIGPNGVGKSTFFKCLIGEQRPDSGIVRLGANVDMGYYDQHQAHLHESKTVLNEVWDDFPKLTQAEARGALGLFLFTGDDVFMPVSTLSGGEKGRVALTKLMLKKDNLLLMDEPTNHLDMDSREVLEDALADYPGTILAVSHDRYFINRFANKVCVLSEDGFIEYLGNYDDYIEKINADIPPDGGDVQKTKTEMDKEKRRSREATLRIKEQAANVAALEKAVADCDTLIIDFETKLADPDTYKDPAAAQELNKLYADTKERQSRLFDEWAQAEEDLQLLKNN